MSPRRESSPESLQNNLPAGISGRGILDHKRAYHPAGFHPIDAIKEFRSKKFGFEIVQYLVANVQLSEKIRNLEDNRAKGIDPYEKVKAKVEQELFGVLTTNGYGWETFRAATVGDADDRTISGNPSTEKSPLLKVVGALGLAGIPVALDIASRFITNNVLGHDIPQGWNIAQWTARIAGLPTVPILLAAGANFDTLRRGVEPDPLYARFAFVDAASKGPTQLKKLAEKYYGSLAISDPDSIAHDDDILSGFDRNRKTDFLNRERKLLLAEIARCPKLGLKMIARYLYDDVRFGTLITKLSDIGERKNVAELNEIAQKQRITDEDTAIKGDPNRKKIEIALNELEIPEMMELFLNVDKSKFFIRYLNDNELPIMSVDENTRYEAFNTVASKAKKPLFYGMMVDVFDYYGSINNNRKNFEATTRKVNNLVRDKALFDLIATMPDENIAAASGGAISKGTPEGVDEAGWSAYKIFSKMYSLLPDDEKARINNDLDESYKRKRASKKGLPLSTQVLKILESGVGKADINMTHFLYTHYEAIILHYLGVPPEKNYLTEYVKGINQIIKSLKKRISLENAAPKLLISTDKNDPENILLNNLVTSLANYVVACGKSVGQPYQMVDATVKYLKDVLHGDKINQKGTLEEANHDLLRTISGQILLEFIKNNFITVLNDRNTTFVKDYMPEVSAPEAIKVLLMSLLTGSGFDQPPSSQTS